MPRNISFALTTPQFLAKTKTVTRRFGWWSLKPETVLCGVEKAMGLKKGEAVKKLGLIEVVSVRSEPLQAITAEDVIKEGFPHWTTNEFIDFLVKHYRIKPNKIVNRIEFKYMDLEP
jgi:hypothetical protein